MRISQCMIVKNEEKNIERALSWGKGIVCEQIVVDTGSTDRTVEIAEKMGAKVYHFAWVDDFAAAKNYALEQAKGDWIAFLDADEYLDDKGVAFLPTILERLSRETVYADGVGKKCDAVRCSMIHLDAKGQVENIQSHTRFFRNDQKIRYEGVIHEKLIRADDRKLVVVDVQDMLNIYHTGYAWTGDLAKVKTDRNIRLLEKLILQRPEAPELQMYMAESLGVRGDAQGSCFYAQLLLNNKDSYEDDTWRLRAYQIVMLAKYQDVQTNPEQLQEIYLQAKKEYPGFPDFDAIMGFCMFDERRYEECVMYLEQALEKTNTQENLLFSRMQEFLKDTYMQLCLSYEELHAINQSFQYAVRALQIDRYEERILYPMLYKLTYKAPAPAEDILGLLKQLYDLSSRKDTLFLLKNIRKVTNVALEQCLKPYMAIEDQQQFFSPFS